MSNRPNFDDDFLSGDSDFDADFFEADSLDADEPAFAGFDDDEIVIPDDGGGGTSRTFVLAGIMIAFLFVIILAIIVALVIGGGEECGPNCLAATEISATNFANQTSIAASQTAIAFEATIAEGTRIAAVATSTQLAVEQATGTQVAINTSVAGTATKISVDATATQDKEFDNRTATANAATDTPTATLAERAGTVAPEPNVVTGQLVDPITNRPAPGVMLCVFLDDGDGVFDPASDSPPNCQLIVTGSSTGGTAVPTTSGVGTGTQQAPAATGTPTTGAPAGTTPTRAVPPPPTAEGGAFNPALYVPVGRNSIDVLQQTTVTVTPTLAATGTTAATGTVPAGAAPAAQQQPPSPTAETGDQFITEIITDDQGNFILRGLPPGNYFIVVGDETLEIEIIQSQTPYLLVVPLASGETITFLVDNIAPGAPVTLTFTPTPSITPTPCPDGTACPGTGGAVSPTATPTQDATATHLAATGLFDGKGDDVTGTDLIILLLAGGILMGVVVTARRLRSNT